MKKQIEILNCIFDVITENPKFQAQSIKTLNRYMRGKNIEIDTTEGKKPTISIGKRFTLTLNED